MCRNWRSAEGVPSSENKIRRMPCATLSLASRQMLSIGCSSGLRYLFLLGGVIEAHLGSWEKQEPEVVEKIRPELYVDDLISGSTSVCKAQELTKKSNSYLSRCLLHPTRMTFT